MKLFVLSTVIICLMQILVIAQTISKPIVFTHVTLIDATGADAQSDMVVIVADGKIADIGKFGKIKLPKNSQLIDATGKFLIPGLWDMHVHLTKAGENTLPLFVANGITSVRDMGGDYVQLLKWRKEAADGTRLSPRIKTPGALLESAENVARMKREGTVEPVDKFRIGIATPEEARKAVDLMASLGVDFIKFRTIASPETYKAIAEESKAKGLLFVGHQSGSPETMVDAGQKSIEHYIYPPIITSPKHAEIYKKMAESGVYIVPTIVVADKSLLVSYDDAKKIVEDRAGKVDFRRKYLSGYLIEDWKEQLEEKKQPSPVDFAKLKEVLIKDLQEMHKAGVRMMPGSDVATLLIYPGYSLHDELQLLVKYVHLTPMQAIVSATRYPAEFFGMQKTLGTIKKGKIADLVLLDANPLDDIGNTKQIAAVVAGGRYFSKELREKMLTDVEAAANSASQTENERQMQDSVEQELRRLVDEWLNSYLRGDKQTFDRIVANDFTGTDESGKVRTKVEERTLVQAVPVSVNASLTGEDVQVRIYKDTAVVTGRIVSKVQGSLNFQSRFTDTFVKRNGRWQVVARHYSRIPTERKAVNLDPKISDAYVGQYELAPNVVLDITKESEKLMSQVTGQTKQELLPESEIEFFLKGINGQFIFVRGESGQVTKLIINQEGQRLTAKRLMNSNATKNSDRFDASEVTELLRDVEERLAKAWVKGDRSFIEQILADDWSVTDLTGRVLKKAEVLEEAFGSKDRQIVSMRIDQINVRPFGNWAIVTGRTQAAGKYRGEVAEVTLRFTDVFAYRNGKWQVVASQATLLSQ